MRVGRPPTQLLGLIVRQQQDSYTLTRVARDRGSLGESARQTSQHTEDVWLAAPRAVESQVGSGERIEGDLGGAALPNADIQQTDEVTYGSETYSVQEITKVPDSDSPSVLLLSLERVNAQ